MTREEVEKLIRELVPSIHEELHEKMLVELRKQKKKWEKLYFLVFKYAVYLIYNL